MPKPKPSFSIILASDHAGVKLKKKVFAHLRKNGFMIADFGTTNSNTKVDYPDYILPACERVAKSNGLARGIVFGKSGIGECIAANKVKGIRASLCFDAQTARLTREHNDSNVLCLGEGTTAGKNGQWQKILDTWLSAEFSADERHVRRIQKIAKYER